MDVLMKETLRPSGTSLKKGRTSITGNFVQIELLIAYNLISSIEPRTSRMSPFKGTIHQLVEDGFDFFLISIGYMLTQ
jgi:hypothetical protein